MKSLSVIFTRLDWTDYRISDWPSALAMTKNKLAASGPGPEGEHMPITLTGTYTATVVLSNPATQNPATIAATGLIDVNSTTAEAVGILGNSGTAWTVTNQGTVE